jgi:hypothetical protein
MSAEIHLILLMPSLPFLLFSLSLSKTKLAGQQLAAATTAVGSLHVRQDGIAPEAPGEAPDGKRHNVDDAPSN